MTQHHPQPRWRILYLTLPLTCVLFWLVGRAGGSGAKRSMLDIAALLIVLAFVETWRLANRTAMLHHPFAHGRSSPVYYVREPAGARITEEGKTAPALLATDAYSDLFSMPARIEEQSSP